MEQPGTSAQSGGFRDIVLVGGGHSHVAVLKYFAQHPEPGVRLTLISRASHTPYSGMLPGYIAGHYSYEQVHIDLGRLADYAGARFLIDSAIGLNHCPRQVLCHSNAPVPYDLLSINIGSTPQMDVVPGANLHALPVKPIHCFNERWKRLLERIKAHPGPTRLAVVGGGAGGVELLLAMQYRLHNELRLLGHHPNQLTFMLFTRSAQILAKHNPWVRRHFEQTLKSRGILLHTRAEVTAVEGGRLSSAGTWYEADEIIWVTHAGGAAWLRDTHLNLDRKGFIQVGDTLQSLSDPTIFAAGDIATQVNHPREKAGVVAVRQGPPLARNLRAAIRRRPLKPYYPQKQWLALITTGDRHAVASRGRFYLAGRWVWRWKDWIDRRFMRKFNLETVVGRGKDI